SQLSSSQKRLDNILGITVNQYYQWINQYYPLITQAYPELTWLTRQWNLSVPLSVYVEYRDRPRPPEWATWVDMAKDPKDDPYIDQLVREITDAALEGRFTEVEKLNFVVAFVQSLPYTVDSVTTPYNEYPRYPIETLFDRGGDCEDTSILVAALLDRMGYDVALLGLKDAKHMAVGVSISNVYGSYYTYKDKKYYYLETTGEDWQIGQIPPDIRDTRASIYPLRS
ncbi:MAG: transglutaminase family protein, partial [Dehalococcoidia bacterium]|nr:transglutaminase family protein [Dehalococcoidia bacterium]